MDATGWYGGPVYVCHPNISPLEVDKSSEKDSRLMWQFILDNLLRRTMRTCIYISDKINDAMYHPNFWGGEGELSKSPFNNAW